MTGKAAMHTLPPWTRTSTKTHTFVSTLPPRSMRAQTVYSTQVVTSTITFKSVSLATATVTVDASATKKVYAACATNNLLGPRLSNGATVISVENNAAKHVISEANSAQACCAQCMEFKGCVGSAFKNPGLCFLYYKDTNTCPAQSANSQAYFTRQGVNAAFGLVVSNGACGYMYNGGSGY